MNEFEKLVNMLNDAKIPYERNDDDPNNEYYMVTGHEPMKRIIYGSDLAPGNCCVCSVIYGWGSYGYDEGLIEIMGLLTPEEEECDDVRGYLTADDVFNRIKKHWEETDGRKKM